MNRLTPTASAGMLAGIFFFAHGMINNSHAWPLIWPLAGGAAAVWLAGRRRKLVSFWSGVGTSAGAGALAALLFFIASAVSMNILGHISPGGTQTALLGLAVAAVSGLAIAMVAGALVYPIARHAEQTGKIWTERTGANGRIGSPLRPGGEGS